MATVRTSSIADEVHYPDSDGRPVGETPAHRDNLLYSVDELQYWFADDEDVYVSGNMFVYYVPGDRHRHVSPDVFVVKGIPKLPHRRRYLVWEEGKGPDAIIEMTSESTREEDIDDKFDIYQNKLKVPEYYLFDPFDEYLDPSLQGWRLKDGKYVRIRPVNGRIPSQVLGLHLERDDWLLRFYNPKTGLWLVTPPEAREILNRQQQELREQLQQLDQQQKRIEQEMQARSQAEAEIERLRRELERLKRGPKRRKR